MGLGAFAGAFIYFKAEKRESPLMRLPAKKHVIRPPKRDEDIDDE